MRSSLLSWRNASGGRPLARCRRLENAARRLEPMSSDDALGQIGPSQARREWTGSAVGNRSQLTGIRSCCVLLLAVLAGIVYIASPYALGQTMRSESPDRPETERAPQQSRKVPGAIGVTRPPGHRPLSTWIKGVAFPHAKHMGVAQCKTCHHMETYEWPGGPLACAHCHKSLDIENPMGFYRIWHSQSDRSCIGCHESARRKGIADTVLDCTSGCHIGKSGSDRQGADR